MVISASWISRVDEGAGQPNLRGIAFLLALSQSVNRTYLPVWLVNFDGKVGSGYSFWAKDIVFVVSDGYLDGMQAWLSAYHGAPQSSESHLSPRVVD
jgi:GPI-anchor transamidase subunit GAA1